jgi:phenylacetate-coenzyme A ligase PaaK-like adenylate-forming protein
MFWEPHIETMPPAELQALQWLRLQATLRRAITSPYYQWKSKTNFFGAISKA